MVFCAYILTQLPTRRPLPPAQFWHPVTVEGEQNIRRPQDSRPLQTLIQPRTYPRIYTRPTGEFMSIDRSGRQVRQIMGTSFKTCGHHHHYDHPEIDDAEALVA